MRIAGEYCASSLLYCCAPYSTKFVLLIIIFECLHYAYQLRSLLFYFRSTYNLKRLNQAKS